MKNRSFISVLILSSILLGTASCGDTGTAQTDTSSGNDTVIEAPEETKLSDTLGKKNYSGADFNIYMPSQHDYEFSESRPASVSTTPSTRVTARSRSFSA